jgi:putative peptide modification system cyclase
MDAHGPALPDASVVRALLLTDLVDSTRLIERLGDRRAARVLGQEEEAARRLAHRYAGQEIDRADGFLFVFEHAWQAVGFALDYHRALEELSVELPLVLQGRVGIHVGETYLVANAAEHVARGAKPVEVSGLAKPIAARLMSAAHGGQTLVSGTVFDLAARPCAEHLGSDRSLHWISHGTWMLKGVEQPVRVHAVGEDERLARREPLENDKVRSLRRLHRRRVLLAGAASLAAVALPAGYWWWKRDAMRQWQSEWLVLADWELSGGDPSLGNVLATALRVALQQSRFAFVMDPGAVQAALQRMLKQPPVRREEALEIARRESAVAAIVPGFAAFGGGILLSAEVVEAEFGRTVGAAQEQLADLGQLTSALDRLAAAIRGIFGEPDIDVQRNTLPLAKVTTANFEALRLYSESDLMMRQRRDEDAIALLERAIVLDPEFASAYAKLGTLHTIRRTEASIGESYWRKAADLGSRLSRREQMYVDGCLSWLEDPTAMRARWSAMASAFPDDAPAVNNAAFVEWTQFGDLVAAERGFRRGLDIPHPWSYIIWHHMAYAQMGQGRLGEALDTFRESLKRADHPAHFGMLRALLLSDRADEARELIERFRGSGAMSWQADHAEAEILLLAFTGDFEKALGVANTMREQALSSGFRTAERTSLRSRLLLCDALGDEAGARSAATALRQVLAPEVHAVSNGALDLPPFELLSLSAFLARKGWAEDGVSPAEILVGRWRRFPVLQAAEHLARGWLALRAGQPDEALRLALQGRDQAPLFAFFELEVAAYSALGQDDSRRERIRLGRERLAPALAEDYNHFATHLPNLLSWQRLGEPDAGDRVRAQPEAT